MTRPAAIKEPMPVLIDQDFSPASLSGASVIQRSPLRTLHRVVLIPGDGIGPEVAKATVRAVEATGVSVEWVRVELNAATINSCGGKLPDTAVEAMQRVRVGMKGPVSTPVSEGFRASIWRCARSSTYLRTSVLCAACVASRRAFQMCL